MYDHKTIEKKWQDRWEANSTYKTDAYDFSKPKYFVMDMFPYPIFLTIFLPPNTPLSYHVFLLSNTCFSTIFT